MTLSLALLALGVLAYGVAGAQLTTGSRDAAGALRSLAWWSGTALQGVGFLLTFVARHELPLLLVQAGVVGALGVTAAVQSVRGVARLSSYDVAAVAGLVVGLALLAVSSETGPAPDARPEHIGVLLLVLAPALAGTSRGWPAVVFGALAGTAFGVGAVAARVLVAKLDVLLTWPVPLSGADLAAGILVVASLGLGQLNLTRGLGRGHPVAVLGSMYAASTVVPAAIGWLMLGEHPRQGTEWAMAAALVLTAVAAARLLRLDGEMGAELVSPGGAPRT